MLSTICYLLHLSYSRKKLSLYLNEFYEFAIQAVDMVDIINASYKTQWTIAWSIKPSTRRPYMAKASIGLEECHFRNKTVEVFCVFFFGTDLRQDSKLDIRIRHPKVHTLRRDFYEKTIICLDKLTPI